MSALNIIAKQKEYGKALAALYIAAQEGVSQEASDAACDLIGKAHLWAKFAFNQELARTKYNVRAPTTEMENQQ